jgi:hypothetical protein
MQILQFNFMFHAFIVSSLRLIEASLKLQLKAQLLIILSFLIFLNLA